MKRIGIIGGMGPQATIDLYQRIVNATPAQCDQDHLPVIIDSYPQIEDRSAHILGQGIDPSTKLIESAQRLANAGAELLIMACNTAHYYAENIRAAVSIPLLHIAEISVAHIRAQLPQGSQIAIFATDGTHRARIYSAPLLAAGYVLPTLTPTQQTQLMQIIYAGAKQGKVRESAPQLQALIDAVPADAYLLACTELPLFLPYLSSTRPLLDPTQVLAEAALDYALNSKPNAFL